MELVGEQKQSQPCQMGVRLEQDGSAVEVTASVYREPAFPAAEIGMVHDPIQLGSDSVMVGTCPRL